MVEQIDSIFDYVVVGGGLAGRAVVARLSENPDVRVILIEAGDENRYSAPLIRYLLTEQREREHDRFLRIVRMNAVLIEQLTLMIEELQRQIADRKQAEETLRQAQADLAHANRVSRLGELTASLTHELSQPICAAITNANVCIRWLSRDQPALQEARAAASRVVLDGRRAGEIVERVRLLFKKDTLQWELVDLNEIIRETILLLHSEATHHGVSLQSDLSADRFPVMGDRVQLQQVLINLMMNSIDAMKDLDGTRELCIQTLRDDDGKVLISVSDTGRGLPASGADKIFDAFFTTKTEGTGMGLRICRSIVESHGGHLWAVDNLPRGARFYFTLPVRH